MIEIASCATGSTLISEGVMPLKTMKNNKENYELKNLQG